MCPTKNIRAVLAQNTAWGQHCCPIMVSRHPRRERRDAPHPRTPTAAAGCHQSGEVDFRDVPAVEIGSVDLAPFEGGVPGVGDGSGGRILDSLFVSTSRPPRSASNRPRRFSPSSVRLLPTAPTSSSSPTTSPRFVPWPTVSSYSVLAGWCTTDRPRAWPPTSCGDLWPGARSPPDGICTFVRFIRLDGRVGCCFYSPETMQ